MMISGRRWLWQLIILFGLLVLLEVPKDALAAPINGQLVLDGNFTYTSLGSVITNITFVGNPTLVSGTQDLSAITSVSMSNFSSSPLVYDWQGDGFTFTLNSISNNIINVTTTTVNHITYYLYNLNLAGYGLLTHTLYYPTLASWSFTGNAIRPSASTPSYGSMTISTGISVPEPSLILLLGIGILSVAGCYLRMSKN